ncbi:MAG: hypothetical protein WBG86_13710, partial [Polyangiales bacterium]
MRFGLIHVLVAIALAMTLGCGDDAGGENTGGTGGAETFDAYPTNLCVGEKQAAAATFCQRGFEAWAEWEENQDGDSRDAAIAEAESTLAESWGASERAAAEDGIDCADLAMTASEAAKAIGGHLMSFANTVNDGLDLGSRKQTACGARTLS